MKNWNTVADLQAASFGSTGQLTETKGYTAAGDGGEAAYLIKTAAQAATDGDTIDEIGAGFTLADTKVAVLQNSGAINVRQFGAVGDGVADDTASIQAAIVESYAITSAVYYPSGIYLISSTITMGNTAGDAAKFCYFYGEGEHSEIKVTSANVNPFLWQGPNPDTDGAGNRIDGRILVEKMLFTGPSSFGGNTNSIGVKFYGAQGIILRDVEFKGWYDGEHYQNCDIVSRYNIRNTNNFNGVNTSATGYAITGEGQLNSFNTYGGLVNGNTNWGIQYVGGLAPCFFGTNFVINGTSLEFSPNNAGGATVTEEPFIQGCYFENDTGTTIKFGGGNGIVRGGKIQGGFMIAAAAVPLITIANYSSAFGAGDIDIPHSTAFAGSSFITQTSSAEKIPTTTQTAYTPSFSSDGGALSIGDGLLSGKYRLIGDTCHVQIFFQVGATTTLGANSAWRFGLPFTATPSPVGTMQIASGTAYINDAGTGWATAIAVIGSGSVDYVKLRPSNGVVNTTQVTNLSPMTWVVGDYLAIELTYQIVLP